MSVTVEQARWLADHANEVEAFSAGLGSDGYPPPPNAWASLRDGRSVWITPEGDELPAGTAAP